MVGFISQTMKFPIYGTNERLSFLKERPQVLLCDYSSDRRTFSMTITKRWKSGILLIPLALYFENALAYPMGCEKKNDEQEKKECCYPEKKT